MGKRLTFKYDREADILHIDKCPPYSEQESEELGDEVIARLNPGTGEIENLEVLFFYSIAARRPLRAAGVGGIARRSRRLAGGWTDPPGQVRGVCRARNSLTRTLAASSAAPVFHSLTNSQPGISRASSSEIG